MLIVLREDHVLCLYETVDHAVGDVEPLDAEKTFRAIFDDVGQVYGIHWMRPNRRR